MTCRIVEASLPGAAAAADARPPRELITLGKTPGPGRAAPENGFAVEFTRLQHPDFLEENVTQRRNRTTDDGSGTPEKNRTSGLIRPRTSP